MRNKAQLSCVTPVSELLPMHTAREDLGVLLPLPT